MPANDKTMAVVRERTTKAENDDVVANCDIKRGTRRQVLQTLMELGKMSPGLEKL